ncbi:MAG: hypothetical protein FJX57_25810, partial [Alphaproteobacteria bacterium]|nr:hypothetical protein [Alphaproteobacteria bacterium]
MRPAASATSAFARVSHSTIASRPMPSAPRMSSTRCGSRSAKATSASCGIARAWAASVAPNSPTPTRPTRAVRPAPAAKNFAKSMIGCSSCAKTCADDAARRTAWTRRPWLRIARSRWIGRSSLSRRRREVAGKHHLEVDLDTTTLSVSRHPVNPRRHEAATGDPEMTKTIRATCAHDCPDMCSLLVEVDGDRIVKIQGDPEQPFTDGFACAKVNRDHEVVHSALRVKTPLRRTGPKGSGRFEPITWDAALDEIETRWKAIIKQHGPEALLGYCYSSHQGQINRHLPN